MNYVSIAGLPCTSVEIMVGIIRWCNFHTQPRAGLKILLVSVRSKASVPEIDDDNRKHEAEEEEDDDEFVQAQIRKGIGQGNTLEEKPTDRKYQQEVQVDQVRSQIECLLA